MEDGTAGGFSRVVTLARALQAQGRDVRILHGGDFLYPSLESQLWDGLQMVDAMNFLNGVAPLYTTSGNHEFDRRGPEQLIAAIHASEFAWLGDNYTFNTGDAAADAGAAGPAACPRGRWAPPSSAPNSSSCTSSRGRWPASRSSS